MKDTGRAIYDLSTMFYLEIIPYRIKSIATTKTPCAGSPLPEQNASRMLGGVSVGGAGGSNEPSAVDCAISMLSVVFVLSISFRL